MSTLLPCSDGLATYRIRLFNWNMANNSDLKSLKALNGLSGRGRFSSLLTAPFPDGSPVDLVYATLVETQTKVSTFRPDKALRSLYTIVTQNAKKSDPKNQAVVDDIATSFNGNLKGILSSSSSALLLSKKVKLHGKLVGDDKEVLGKKLANPKKAFVGSAVHEANHGVRIWFVSAHFPVAALGKAILEHAGANALRSAAVAMAQSLRKVMIAAARGGVDSSSLVVVQGDLNSRSVLLPSKAPSEDGFNEADIADVLWELLHDEEIQESIQRGLDVPAGRWYELTTCEKARALPVTYKLREQPPPERSGVPRVGTSGEQRGGLGIPPPTLGSVIDAANRGARDGARRGSGVEKLSESGASYVRTLEQIPSDVLDAWAIPLSDVREVPYRFPASADRVIYWAPDALADSVSWKFVHGGAEVDYTQGGSDHRPVYCEVLLRIGPLRKKSAEDPETKR